MLDPCIPALPEDKVVEAITQESSGLRLSLVVVSVLLTFFISFMVTMRAKILARA